ncbi:MAG: ABC transporter permease [Planctomycetes bacterium]|nr:ABC transporter permease [Planctomycetota bacterium]
MKNKFTEFAERLGISIVEVVDWTGYATFLYGQAILLSINVAKIRRFKAMLFQCWVTGIESMGVTLLFAIFSGMVLALQTGYEMKRFGAEALIGALVAVSMTREMGPMMTAIILTGRSGSAMAAELGTMNVSEEVEALEVMSINPTNFLVVPRLIAMSIMTPALTIFANVFGILGGSIVARYMINVEFSVYFREVWRFLDLWDSSWGIFKAWIFGMGIATIACAQGLRARNGAEGVGRATRNAVVIGLMFVVSFNFFLSAIYKILEDLGFKEWLTDTTGIGGATIG